MRAWYFSADDKRLRYNDGRLIKAGGTHKVKGRIETCENGLHASKRIIDALSYGYGSHIWRVELSGDMDKASDKVAARERKYLWGFNAENALRKFSRQCALDVIHLWDAPDVVVKYLKTGDESLRAAAWAAAGDAAGAAAWAAAGAAAWAAARDAAGAAAGAAAWDVAWAAAGDAAGAAAWAAARDAAGAAAGAAAWAAARDAALDKFNKRLTRMINAEAKKRGLI